MWLVSVERSGISTRWPQLDRARLIAELVPPPHFSRAAFSNYRPDPAHPSQSEALAQFQELATRLTTPARKSLFKRKSTSSAQNVYLDGGFGVGKTHLLAALAHQVGPEQSVFGTFVEYTNLVGALGFQESVAALKQRRLVCIDEFELDDPGDTVLMSRLLRELDDAGVTIAATSNTLPDSLGEGRFAAEDFLREIQALAARFAVYRIDGPDYRHRAASTTVLGVEDMVLDNVLEDRVNCSIDEFGALLDHLRAVHPSRYGALVEGVTIAGIRDVSTVSDQLVGLRLVVLIDRLYDRDVPVLLSGAERIELFTEEMLRSGYRKKYLRALSRLGALTSQGRQLCGV